ncbi:DNA polymerase III subunit beta [Labrys portucalensis]|uniref:Beta sliding clamp n=1 Tax=Labrys neptuniae TaxID=376174 RepID=A0ABV6Z8L3_9HYPH
MPATITMERGSLWAALQAVSRIIDRKNTIPILGNVLIVADTGSVTITSTNLDMRIEATVPADGDAFALTVPAGAISDIVRKFDDGAQVSMTAEDTRVIVRSGRSRFTLLTLPALDYPSMQPQEWRREFSIPAAALQQLLTTVDFAISTEETRYYLNGIYLHAVDDAGTAVLRAVATDGHRLARDQVEAPADAVGMPGIIVPTGFVAEASRFLSSFKTAGEVRLEIAETMIRLSAANTVLQSKLVDGTFPDYARVIPRDNGLTLAAARAELAAAVDRVSAIGSAAKSREIELALEADKVNLSCRSIDVGDGGDELDATFDGPEPMKIYVNSRYLLDILAHCPGDQVLMRVSDPMSPFLFEPSAGAAAQFVLMPMRKTNG